MKGYAVTSWFFQIALAVFFVMAGSMKVAGTAAISERFQAWGYGEGFLVLIGAVETLGGVGLLIPRIVALAAIGLMAVMGGALYTHLIHAEGMKAATPALILIVLLGVVTYFRWGTLQGFLRTLKGLQSPPG
jgi:putative oxidoreductase